MDPHKNYAIPCPTYEEAENFIKFLYEHTSIRWSEDPAIFRTEWEQNKENTYYFIDHRERPERHEISVAGTKINILQSDVVITTDGLIELLVGTPDLDTAGVDDLL